MTLPTIYHYNGEEKYRCISEKCPGNILGGEQNFCCPLLRLTINTFLKLEICVVCREFLAYNYVSIVFFQNKSDDYSYLYIRNLENLHLKPGFPYTISICICVGR